MEQNKKGKGLKCNFYNLVNVAYGGIFLLFSIYMLFNFNNSSLNLHMLVLLYVAIIISVMFLCFKVIDNTKDKTQKIIAFLFFALVFLLQIAIFSSASHITAWDYEIVIDNAINGLTNWWYFAACPNNIVVTMFLRVVVVLTNFLSFIPVMVRLVIVNIIFVDFSIFILYLLSKRLFNNKIAKLILIFSILFLALNAWVSTVYTDTLSMPFPILIIYCFVRIAQSKNLKEQKLFSLILGFVCVLGAYIKLTAVIASIAIIISLLLVKRLRNGIEIEDIKKTATKCIAFFLVSVIVFLAIVNIALVPINYYMYKVADKGINRGFLYFIETGLATYGYGGWNSDTYNWTMENILENNYEQMAIERILIKINEYGVTGMVGHLYGKLLTAGTDGSFDYGGEGVSHPERQGEQNTLKYFLQSYHWSSSDFYKSYVWPFSHALWIIVCLLNAFSLFISIGKIKSNEHYKALSMVEISVFISKLAVGGLLLFLLIFENRSRYILLYLPVVLFVAEYQLAFVFEKAKNKKEKVIK